MKNNKIVRLMLAIVIITLVSTATVYAGIKIFQNYKKQANLTPIFTGKIGNTDYNSIWVGTFNLAWNELMDQYVGGKVEFEGGNTEFVNELNKQTFKKDQLSEEDYYIKTGKTSPQLKEQILADIKEKFNIQKSLLDNFSFEPTTPKDFTIYAMLYKDFNFMNPFDKLPSGNFGQSEEIVQYFGINSSSKETLNGNVRILFYNNEKDFAVKLSTQENEEIILYRTDENKTFNQYYEDIENKTDSYKGRYIFEKNDQIRIPYINIEETINYDELCGKEIKGTERMFLKTAAQNVKFILSEYGGRLSSEALIMGSYNSFSQDEPPFYFYFDDTFILFMKEAKKEQPYMALKVDNTEILVKE